MDAKFTNCTMMTADPYAAIERQIEALQSFRIDTIYGEAEPETTWKAANTLRDLLAVARAAADVVPIVDRNQVSINRLKKALAKLKEHCDV